jgi:hypothetical protein
MAAGFANSANVAAGDGSIVCNGAVGRIDRYGICANMSVAAQAEFHELHMPRDRACQGKVNKWYNYAS